MKRFGMIIAGLMMCGVLIAGYQANMENRSSHSENEAPEAVETMNQQAENGDLETTEVIKGLDTVLQTISKLQETVERAPKDAKQINEVGQELEENWDKIEKAVEKRDPEPYKYIEDSLYPLIAEAKKPAPESDRIKPLIKDTTKKLKEYKEKLS